MVGPLGGATASAAPAPGHPGAPAPRVAFLGDGVEVPCVDGSWRPYVDLDCAATSPAMVPAWEAMEAFLPYYGSANRGSGFKSHVTSQAIDDARATVARFLGAPGATVVFTTTTTHATNVLAHSMRPGRILCEPGEHHANLLPWRRHEVRMLPFANGAAEALEAIRAALAEDGPFDLLTVTGASNVTGEVWPLKEICELAHDYGTEVFVDAAQLAPHRPLSMDETGADYAAFSGHKLYAPFGVGALVCRSTAKLDGDPLISGGGSVRMVTLDEHRWAGLPGRHEAGSPNVPGIVALAAACETLMGIGMERVAAHDRTLRARLVDGLARYPQCTVLSQWPEHTDTIGVVAFSLDGVPYSQLSTVLGAEHAVGVRSGRFCANPLVLHLMGASDECAREALRTGIICDLPGAVRASIGLPVTEAHLDAFFAALDEIVERGPRWTYSHDPTTGAYEPTPDPRPDLMSMRTPTARR